MSASETKTDIDVVNRPSHYMGKGGLQVIDAIEAFDLQHNHYRATAVAYLMRAGRKGDDEVQDLKKARWYINREIASKEGAPEPADVPAPAPVAEFVPERVTVPSPNPNAFHAACEWIGSADWYADIRKELTTFDPTHIGSKPEFVVVHGGPSGRRRAALEDHEYLFRTLNQYQAAGDFPSFVRVIIKMIQSLIRVLIICGVDPRPIFLSVSYCNGGGISSDEVRTFLISKGWKPGT